MTKILNSEFFERMIFTTIVIGILMTLVGAVRFFYISNQISGNAAAQIHASGEEIAPQTNSEVQGLVAADMELRDLVKDRFNMMVVGGIGLAFIGVGWMAMDILRSRRKKNDESSVPPTAEATS
jgi:hypothetical protein